MTEGLTVLLAVGAWFAAAALVLAAQVWYYRVRRYGCPACGRPGLRVVVLGSSPWVRTLPPVRVHRYACDRCAAAFREVEGAWGRDDGGAAEPGAAADRAGRG